MQQSLTPAYLAVDSHAYQATSQISIQCPSNAVYLDVRMNCSAAGPPSLVVDARDATHRASRTARRLGLKGIPELAFSNHSFTL